ncbi:hypothetical protein FACS1894176_10970 [Bacteroidia bacterium]|nr:hypothetical protein FACS189428_1300 [Clostridia bacterium]GHV28433.1 hypothetical protein FACS1894176_10970 [Bacteroidia bacterium]
MTDPILTPPDPIETPIPTPTEATFSSGVSSVFQATASLNDLAKESISVGQNLVGEVNQFGHSIVENVGEIMAEPGKLFQPTKTVSTLGNLVGASVEGVKNLANDTIGLATEAVGDIKKTGSDLANVRIEPKSDGGVMQPARPISELSSI